MGLVKALIEKKYEVYAIAPPDNYSHLLVKAGCRYYPVHIDNKGTNPFKDIYLIYRLYRIYKKTKPDIVIHYTIKPNIYGTLAAQLIKIPVINNVSGLGTVFIHENYILGIAKMLYKLAFKYPKKVFFHNHDDLRLFLNSKIVNKKLTGVLPGSGIDVNKFTPCPAEWEPDLESDSHGSDDNKLPKDRKGKQFTFLLFSRLLLHKGIVEYIEAIKILKHKKIDARFQLLGPIETMDKLAIPQHLLESWIKNKLVEYLGSTDNVIPFIKAADCVVLPSYREGLPRTLLEAASMGKPLITTNTAGCKEIVKHNFNGYLCKVKDAHDLAQQMMKMVSLDSEKLKRFSEHSRALVVGKYDEEIVIDTYLTTIKEIIE